MWLAPRRTTRGGQPLQIVQQTVLAENLGWITSSRNNLTTDKIETKVQFAPSFAFGLGFVLVFRPLALAEDLQAGAVDNQMDRT